MKDTTIQTRIDQYLQRGNSVWDLCFASRVPEPTIRRIMLGQVKRPQRGTLDRLEKALRIAGI